MPAMHTAIPCTGITVDQAVSTVHVQLGAGEAPKLDLWQTWNRYILIPLAYFYPSWDYLYSCVIYAFVLLLSSGNQLRAVALPTEVGMRIGMRQVCRHLLFLVPFLQRLALLCHRHWRSCSAYQWLGHFRLCVRYVRIQTRLHKKLHHPSPIH